MPSKSVTAVIGVKEERGKNVKASVCKCQTCSKTDCLYRETQDGGAE